MLRYHHFSAGVNWMDEYGYVDEDGAIDYLLKYSPLHTVKKVKYPWMWVVTGDHDDRVVPSHSFKYVAELQYTAGQVEGQSPIFLQVVSNQGHGSEVSKAEWLALIAFVTKTPVYFDPKLDNIRSRFANQTKGNINDYLASEETRGLKKQISTYNSLISSL